ncbi:hypothetical protein [Kaarinaea lacus]
MIKAVVDRKTLAWVKQGIDETLQSVHHAPDQFAENLEDTASIESCIAPLRRVRGAVEIVGIHGATLLAMELEDLAQAIVNGKVKQKREAAEVLATGMLQLPGYLESLYHGQPDIPLILLPLLNDLRAVQDKELLTEGEFFSPDLSTAAPIEAAGECIVNGDLTTVAKKLRPGYLSGMLGVVKDENVTESLEKLILVVDNLLIASSSEKAKQLWWIASGVIDSLYEKGLESSVSVKKLLARVDQQIQRVIEHGENALSQDPPNNIIKNLLYYIAQSQANNTRVNELKKAFSLDYIDDSVVKKARENLYGFNVNLIENISEQVKEVLSSIKDSLDVAMHAKGGSTDGLEPVLQQFSTVADTLAMLGMNTQKTLINEYTRFLEPKIIQGETLDEEDFMGVASALLHVESALSGFGTNLQAAHNGSALPPAEYEKLLKLVAHEILTDIKQIKEAVNDFADDYTNVDLLQPVPELLEHITGATYIMRHEVQSHLSKAVSDFVSNELINENDAANPENMDLLADAITGLENYYQTILEESVAPEIGLQVASQSIAKLGYPIEVPTLSPLDTSTASEEQYNFA